MHTPQDKTLILYTQSLRGTINQVPDDVNFDEHYKVTYKSKVITKKQFITEAMESSPLSSEAMAIIWTFRDNSYIFLGYV